MPKEKLSSDPYKEDVVDRPVVPANQKPTEEKRAQGPFHEGDDRRFLVKHSLYGPFPRGHVFSVGDMKLLSPGFKEKDLEHGLTDHPGIGPAIEATIAEKSPLPDPSAATIIASQKEAEQKAATTDVAHKEIQE